MNNYRFSPEKYRDELTQIVKDLLRLEHYSEKALDKILKRYPKDRNQIFSRDQLISGIRLLKQEAMGISNDALDMLISSVKMKPMRTQSGVTTVTVLTKPFACPGKCIFCPNDVRMPKSYIASEPGAQRALMFRFNPYVQVFNRLKALDNIGHPTSKVELLILGGTWSYYPKKYQVWFIKECFRAMNEFASGEKTNGNSELLAKNASDISGQLRHDFNDELRSQVGDKPYNQLLQTKEYKEYFQRFITEENSLDKSLGELWDELQKEQVLNSAGGSRCVGLVLETRPDTITEKEVYDLRKLGATKIQLGIQTLDDRISELNKRGEYREQTAKAFNLLRAGGFKIHAHIMPNLLGATPELDLQVYKELFSSLDYKPDELKIYPTSIIKHTELYDRWQAGDYQPYTTDELIDLIAACMEATPEYCRLTRIIRDIPSTEIEGGNRTTNLREAVEAKLKKDGRSNPNIRAREIRSKKVGFEDLKLDTIKYSTRHATEYFLQYITDERELAGFLRLSLPHFDGGENPITPELDGCALIREVHVYGPSLDFSKNSIGEAQHLGLGTRLLTKARELAMVGGFARLAVISSIGTREYYHKRGFELKELYQIAELG